MHVTRLADAHAYEAPGHFDMRGLRLQGFDASPSEAFWVGLSCFLPAGGADEDTGPLERVYVVLDGEVTVTTAEGDTVLHALDSCHIAAGETRSIVNTTNRPASMLVVMPHPEGTR
jgi:quercetin dioxygenase-like cupin family protein